MRLALAQMRVDAGRPDLNLPRAVDWIGRAAAAGAQLVLLPEALDWGWTDPAARAGAQPIPGGDAFRQLATAASAHRVYVAAGLTERDGERVFNAAVLIDPTGRLLLHHRKLNELSLAHGIYDPGDRLGVVRLPWGTVGLMICADGFADGECVSRTLGLMGADLILSPCAWAVPPERDLVREPYGDLWRDCHGRVAAELRLTIAAVSGVGTLTGGPWAGRSCIGNSLVMGPAGQELLTGPSGVMAEALLFLELPPAQGLRRSRDV
jgi:predicted amidohydrolase